MRGRKRENVQIIDHSAHQIKKESPNEGTETICGDIPQICIWCFIKKESPNEGTETSNIIAVIKLIIADKKRIPEWGDGNPQTGQGLHKIPSDKKRIPEWGDGNYTLTVYRVPKSPHKKRIPEWGDGNIFKAFIPPW